MIYERRRVDERIASSFLFSYSHIFLFSITPVKNNMQVIPEKQSAHFSPQLYYTPSPVPFGATGQKSLKAEGLRLKRPGDTIPIQMAESGHFPIGSLRLTYV